MRDGQKIAVVGGVCAAVLSAVGFGAYSMVSAEHDTSGTATTHPDDGAGPNQGNAAAEPPTDAEIEQVSDAFLGAWAAGDTTAAAQLTNDPDAARPALRRFARRTGMVDLALTPGLTSSATVPFTVDATVTHQQAGTTARAAWAYESELTVVRDAETGEAVVDFGPSVIHPKLRAGQSVETGTIDKLPPVTVLDRNGDPLTAEDHPTLDRVLADFQLRYLKQSGAAPGAELRIVDARGERVKQLLTVAEPIPGEVPTTLDPTLQATAEQAVANARRASLVAIRPSTGEILAVANNPADDFDTALQGSYAPGSTFKVVTGSLLIDKSLAAPDAPHPCPKFFTYGGWRFQNLDKFEIENGTFADSFAASCNTAFISQAPELADSDLSQHARDVFGLGLTWEVGVTSMDGSVPTQSDAQMAASLIGQGGVRMNPLTMASVSATVKAGQFHQPYLVPPTFDGRKLAEAARPLTPDAAQQLRSLMNRTAVNGTAAEAMAGLDGDFGGKTGSAEVDGQHKPNAWFTAYRDDLAAAAVVPNSGHGGEFAGPVVAEVLRAGS